LPGSCTDAGVVEGAPAAPAVDRVHGRLGLLLFTTAGTAAAAALGCLPLRLAGACCVARAGCVGRGVYAAGRVAGMGVTAVVAAAPNQ
jgi:hypothetical protein